MELGKCRRYLPGCFSRVFFCFVYYLDIFVRRGFGRVLRYLVFMLISFVLFIVVSVILPFYAQRWHLIFMVLLACLAVYFCVNIIFNFVMAAGTPSGRPQHSFREPQCRRCNNYKSPITHHCSMCDECVVLMDHHCIWINRCVGAGNHRYFFQFLGFLSLACTVLACFSFQPFYQFYYAANRYPHICYGALPVPWIPYFCQNFGPDFFPSSILFCALLSFIISVVVGLMFIWNFYLISNEITYIDILRGNYNSVPKSWCTYLTPWRSPHFKDLWIDFFNLHEGRRFHTHVLLPSTHRPLIALDWGPKLAYHASNISV